MPVKSSNLNPGRAAVLPKILPDMNLEHIGIAVHSLQESIPLFEKLLQRPCYKVEDAAQDQVRTAFFDLGTVKVELLESSHADGPIARFLEKRGPGMHHVALEVQDIEAEASRLTQDGFRMIGEHAHDGADNKRVWFMHPKEVNGVLIELCQAK